MGLIVGDEQAYVYVFLRKGENTLSPGTAWHRGANLLAPENTVVAAEIAYGFGADFVEIDVRTTADHELIVLHDRALNRTTDDTGEIAKRSLWQTRMIDAGRWFDDAFASTAVPTLRDMLDCARRNSGGLYIELKAADARQVVQQVRGTGMIENCFFWSQNPETLAELAGCGDDVTLMIRRCDYQDFGQALIDFRPRIVEFLTDEASNTDFDTCRQAGAKCMTYIDKSESGSFAVIAASGTDLINTDFSMAMLDLLRTPDLGTAVA